MKNLLAIVLLSTFFVYSFAQKSPVKFGDIPIEDLKMTVYDKDSSAVAVVLVDYGKTSFTYPRFNFETHLRIKILKQEGLQYADGSIPLQYVRDGANELNFKASTYNLENGKVVETKLTADEMFKEKITQDFKVKKFTFPNVKVGSVIEYSYSIKTPWIAPWGVQDHIPTRLNEFWAIIPTDITIKNYAQGYVKATNYEVKESAAATTYHWVFDDVPAFKPEPLMASEEDFRSKINFYLTHVHFGGVTQEYMGSWKKINDEMLKDKYFGEVIKTSFFLKDITQQIVADTKDPMEKVQKIYSHVKNHYEWNQRGGSGARNLSESYQKKIGSTEDINLTLASMLQKAGLKVNMVFLSTRENGVVRQEIPLLDQFNYLICAVTLPTQIILVDATERFLPLGFLPARCINGQGLMLDEEGPKWVPTDFLPVTKTSINANLMLGEITKGEISFVRDGYDALRFRKEYAEKGEEKYVTEFLGSQDWDLEKSEFEKLNELAEPTKEKYSIIANKVSMDGNAMVYVEPMLAGRLKENPFTETDRKFPINYPSTLEKAYMGKIVVPDNFVVDELPKGMIMSLPDKSAKFTYSVTQLGNTISIYSNFKIAKTVFIQEEYLQLKEFYSQVIAKQAEQIVLKRK